MAYDVKREFERLCGPDVRYISDELWPGNRRLIIKFSVEGTDIIADAYADLRDGTEREMRIATQLCAKRAQDYAYNATGKRNADLYKLMNGRTIKNL